MYYPREIIDQVIEANNIVELIGEYIKLTKKGNNYFGLCPFHNEKTGSFSVSNEPGRQMYYCFGCHASGSALTFLMKYENMNFQEALEELAKRAGIELPKPDYKDSKKASERAKLKEEILAANKEAATYFYKLLKSSSGQRAREYVLKRGLTEETVKNFGIGYADKYRDDLYNHLKEKGFSDNVLTTARLVTAKDNDVYDFFWNRLMFPIMDIRGKVIGFGGRVLGDGEPKYLNTPETIVFEKNRNLFGMNYARKHKGEPFILCEGNMDVISMHQAGFTNAVASLGTSLTVGQAGLLKRFTDNVYIAYDADDAGRNAALRAIGILRDAGISVKVVDHSPYKDPDELIKAEGKEAYEKRLKKALNGLIFEILMMQKSYNLNDIDEKTKFEKSAAKRLSYIRDEFERENYVKAVSKVFNIDLEMLRRVSRELALNNNESDHYKPEKSVPRLKKKNPDEAIEKCSAMILSYLTENSEAFNNIKEILSPSDYLIEPFVEIAKIIYKEAEEGKISLVSIINSFDDVETQEEIAEKLCFNFGDLSKEQKEKALTESVIRLKTEALLRQRESETEIGKIVEISKQIENLRSLKIFGGN